MGITLNKVSYTYQAGTPFEGPALFEVDLEIKDGSYTALIGHTGSGKSTILQLLNGLLTPSEAACKSTMSPLLQILLTRTSNKFVNRLVWCFNLLKVRFLMRLF